MRMSEIISKRIVSVWRCSRASKTTPNASVLQNNLFEVEGSLQSIVQSLSIREHPEQIVMNISESEVTGYSR